MAGLVVGGALVLAGCGTGSGSGSGSGAEGDPGPPGPVPIAGVGAVDPSDGLITAVPDDPRRCPTTFELTAAESADEVRLTITARGASGAEFCVGVPQLQLEAPLGKRTIIDATSGRTLQLSPGAP